MVIAVTLVAALLLGTGFVLQQRAASCAPLGEMLHLSLLWRLMHSPQWLCGIACMVAAIAAVAAGLVT